MKTIAICILLLSTLHAGAQGKFGKDGSGRYVFYFRDSASIQKERLKSNLVESLAAEKEIKLKKSTVDSKGGIDSIVGTGIFEESRNLSFVSRPQARVFFHMLVEVKDEKYRILLSDFHFNMLSRDRFGNFTAMSLSPLALESESVTVNRKDQTEVISKCEILCQQFASRIKSRTGNPPVKPRKSNTDTVRIEKW